MWCKNFLFWCITSMSLVPGFGLANGIPAKVPQAFLPESVYEFQPVLEGTQVVHEFALKNNGDAPLNILQVKPG